MTVADPGINRSGNILRIWGWSAVALVLLTPAIAMQFSEQVHWTGSDFALAGILLAGGGAVIELLAARVRRPRLRIGLAVIIVSTIALIWAEGAVGLFR